MRSAADQLRQDTRRRLATRSPWDRVTLALELGDADLAALVEARGVAPEAARAAFARSRRAGRRPSRSHDD